MKSFLKSPDKRKFYNDEWLDLSFFQKFKPLFCTSELAIRLVGIKSPKKILILPFLFEWNQASDEDILIFKTSINNLNISINYFEQIVKDSWDARDTIYEDMTLEIFNKLFKELIGNLDNLLKSEEVWIKARKI